MSLWKNIYEISPSSIQKWSLQNERTQPHFFEQTLPGIKWWFMRGTCPPILCRKFQGGWYCNCLIHYIMANRCEYWNPLCTSHFISFHGNLQNGRFRKENAMAGVTLRHTMMFFFVCLVGSVWCLFHQVWCQLSKLFPKKQRFVSPPCLTTTKSHPLEDFGWCHKKEIFNQNTSWAMKTTLLLSIILVVL